MAKGGKLTKLKSVLKRWQSIGRNQLSGRQNASSIAAATTPSDDEETISGGAGLRAVFVGKSRRRYLVSADVIEHPVVRELVERSGESEEEEVIVGCEVVLFEHLLWMLHNADPQPESLEELVEFYSC